MTVNQLIQALLRSAPNLNMEILIKDKEVFGESFEVDDVRSTSSAVYLVF